MFISFKDFEKIIETNSNYVLINGTSGYLNLGHNQFIFTLSLKNCIIANMSIKDSIYKKDNYCILHLNNGGNWQDDKYRKTA